MPQHSALLRRCSSHLHFHSTVQYSDFSLERSCYALILLQMRPSNKPHESSWRLDFYCEHFWLIYWLFLSSNALGCTLIIMFVYRYLNEVVLTATCTMTYIFCCACAYRPNPPLRLI